MKITVNRRKLLSIALVLTLSLTLLIPVSAYQEYTQDSEGATVAKGSLYAHQVDDYVRIGAATTYVSGGSGRATAYAYLYTNNSNYGPYSSGATSGSLASGVSAQTGQQVFPVDAVTYISCSHHVELPNGSVLTPPGQSYSSN